MAENQKDKQDVPAKVEPAVADETQVDTAPGVAGRSQLGEKVEGTLSTKAPRGVGEPPSDAKAEEGGVRELQDAVQKQADEENEKGYRGETPDPTPNEHYTVAGVTSGKPTPETVVYTPRGK